MMRSSILIPLIAFVFLISCDLCAQNQKQESTYKSFKSRTSRKETRRLLDDAEALRQQNPSAALSNVQEALASAIANGDVMNEGRSYLLLGNINIDIQEWSLASDNFNKAYVIFQANSENPTEYSSALTGLAYSQLMLGRYDESLANYKQALHDKLSVRKKNEITLSMSEAYYQKGNYAEALSQLNSIQEEKSVDANFNSQVQNQLAKIYAKTNDLPRTQQSYSNSLNNARGQKDDQPDREASIQSTKDEIAGVLRDNKKFDDEILLRNKSVEYNLEKNNLAEVSKDKLKISESLTAKGDNAAALRALEQAVAIADTIQDARVKADAYQSLANFYFQNGNMTKSAQAFRKYSAAVGEAEKEEQTRLEKRSQLIKQQNAIESLSKDVSIGKSEETIEQGTIARQKIIIYGLILILLIAGITTFSIYRSAQASKLANQMLALKSLRSQMNPHFIFNALNSVNQFIALQDERTANKFLSEFSRLMRLVLETSQEDFISFSKEQEILSLYLRLEHYRFRDKFDYKIEIGDTIVQDRVEVPPMLIQPYIENAVWHGLRYKETKGTLLLRFIRQGDQLIVEVIDDGIGRERSAALKTEQQKRHNSSGLRNIEERMSIINKVYGADYNVTVADRAEGGTHVTISFPINEKRMAI